ncbi:actin regulatory protein [Panus rudis PR-1116 ss-1]|nr:actin regulatory protein [Panus rudis PR-1116 ss-1]
MDGVILTKPARYNIEDTNIALLGSDLEKNVREHAGDKEAAWENAGKEPGLQIWRIEKFKVVEWPKERYGYFYDGDAYIVLYTFKLDSNSEELFYNLHFWIGQDSSQDEAATAAYKTVELDDHLHGLPVQYREVQGYESAVFLSYFPRFISLHGGISTGFHHVSSPPPDETKRLYRVTSLGNRLIIREVPLDGSSLIPGDAYVLDMGTKVWQLNTKGSVGKERFKAAEFVRQLVEERGSSPEVTVFDEGGQGLGIFLAALGLESMPESTESQPDQPRTLYRISDATGDLAFSPVESKPSSLTSSDAFLLDDSANKADPAVYAWIGKEASLQESRLTIQYAQSYLYITENKTRSRVAVSLVKMREGRETEGFKQALSAMVDQ